MASLPLVIALSFMQVQFRCKICSAINIKPINPHAWALGTVFAKCANCDITHKLRDNLKLFHEFAGPVFPDPPLNITWPVGLKVPPANLAYDVGVVPWPDFPDMSNDAE
jgi:DNL zinc finger